MPTEVLAVGQLTQNLEEGTEPPPRVQEDLFMKFL